MDKKIVLLFVILFASFVHAAEITLDNVYLGEQIKIDANFEGAGIDKNTLCQFLFYDENASFVIDRATDEYILDNNHVYSVDYTINEPPFFRDSIYTIKAICGNIERTANFNVLNKRGLDNFFFGDFFWIKDNWFIVGVSLLVITVIISFVALFIIAWRKSFQG